MSDRFSSMGGKAGVDTGCKDKFFASVKLKKNCKDQGFSFIKFMLMY
jgi:hypothetical protein